MFMSPETDIATLKRHIDADPENRALHERIARVGARLGQAYGGRELSEWLSLISDETRSASRELTEAFDFFGLLALFDLGRAAAEGPWFARLKAIEALARLGKPGLSYLIPLRNDPVYAIRRAVESRLRAAGVEQC